MPTSRQINVHIVGEREPSLLFVHGFACTLDDWQAQIDELSDTFRCIALDLPGHGASTRPESPTMATLGSAVNRAKEQSGARQVILVGHSLGAKVVREAYAQSMANVIGLVFIEGRFNEGDQAALLRNAEHAIDREGFGAWAQHHFAQMFIESSDPKARARVLERVRKLDPQFGRELFLEAVGWDPARGKQTLSKIEVPVLLLQSTYVDANSKRQPLQRGMTTPFMELVASMIPKSEARVITGCGHFPMTEATRVVNSEIRAFATRIARS